jgi:hypothetical protein
MFTIKHIGPNDTEYLVEARQFLRERRGDGFYQYLAFDIVSSDYTATWCGDERVHNDLAGRQILYVMNEAGATVAVHTFKRPDFSKVPCSAETASETQEERELPQDLEPLDEAA